MKDSLLVNEIFYSLDGEGKRSGRPSIFIRLTGCNLRCNYCDTAYSFTEGRVMSIYEVMKKISTYKCKNITLTGGEPLLQKGVVKLLSVLKSCGYSTIVETNGAVDIKEAQKYASICMDWKMPSSDMEHEMLEENLLSLRSCDVLKLVVRRQDLERAKELINYKDLKCEVYISPVFGEVELSELAEFVKENANNDNVVLQVQLHKIIWSPEMRGV